MTSYLYLSARFLQPYAHGRGADGEPEWPPSPLRLFQALASGAAGRWNERERLERAVPALRWLESLPPPEIVAADGIISNVKRQAYVPDNTADRCVPAWKRGDVAKQANRTEKVIQAVHLGGEAVFYLYRLPDGSCDYVEPLTVAARSMTHLGWGVDMIVGDAGVLSQEQAGTLEGLRWRSTPAAGRPLRVPIDGTLDDLMRKHEAFLQRLPGDRQVFNPVSPLHAYQVQSYRRIDQPTGRPYRVFELRHADGERCRYAPRKLIHVAGMVRHLAIEAMKRDSPNGVPPGWVESYVAGHAKPGGGRHRQLSYLPLPSIGHVHADPGVRRVMVVAPLGDEDWLDHVARRLAGRTLRPARGDEFGNNGPPLLVPVRRDNIASRYAALAPVWASVTPVILPGHDDHKPNKTRKLVEKALAQSGIEQPCDYDWNAFSQFPKSLSAHKYDRNNRPVGYLRPDHLSGRTAVHLTLRFKDGAEVPGPLVVGSGRHCGLGLFAPLDV